MNTINTIERQWHQYLIGIAAVTLTGTGLLVVPPATATQDTGSGGGIVQPECPRDIDEVVTERKVAWAQDRIDRAWLDL